MWKVMVEPPFDTVQLWATPPVTPVFPGSRHRLIDVRRDRVGAVVLLGGGGEIVVELVVDVEPVAEDSVGVHVRRGRAGGRAAAGEGQGKWGGQDTGDAEGEDLAAQRHGPSTATLSQALRRVLPVLLPLIERHPHPP